MRPTASSHLPDQEVEALHRSIGHALAVMIRILDVEEAVLEPAVGLVLVGVLEPLVVEFLLAEDPLVLRSVWALHGQVNRYRAVTELPVEATPLSWWGFSTAAELNNPPPSTVFHKF